MKVNMTPIIDIVFLLIIFLVVVCQQIDAENFEVSVPDECNFAQENRRDIGRFTTITIMKQGPEKNVVFAVGAEKTVLSENENLSAWLIERINAQLKQRKGREKIVSLRIDKDITYGCAQYALAAVAQSDATDIQLATLRER